MPVTLSYPGVYIEEIPSGVRTITGVATSITAFIGRALMGPIDSDPDGPLVINSYGDFERAFGALDANYPMGYAVRDFYLNGGAQAVIVRLYESDGVSLANAAIAIPNLPLVAASAGKWGNNLRARIDINVAPFSPDLVDVAASLGPTLTPADLFNLTVCEMVSGTQETFLNLTVKESPRRVDRVLAASSNFVRVASTLTLPATTVPAASGDAPAGKTVWDQDASSTGVVTAGQASDGAKLLDSNYLGNSDAKTGMYALLKVDLFNLLCIPPDTRAGNTSVAVNVAAMAFCVDRRALLIVDAPEDWATANGITNNNAGLTELGLFGVPARNAAVFFPRVIESDPARQGQLDTFVPCGIVAGVMARTDTQRGVWKAPAGLDASLNGVQGLATVLTDAENGMLNPIGVNCLRNFPLSGPVVWGSRTLRGSDLLADDYKYIPVRRLALYIEESLFRGTQWVVFEPNDNPLWAQIRLNVGAFMQNLFRQGAFQGKTPTDAYFVKCDSETTTQNDIDLGIVNIVVGFAPLKPAEFVVIQLQQMAGQIQT